jgi:PAS domain S-box-containing protein
MARSTCMARSNRVRNLGRLHEEYHRALFAHHPDGFALVDPAGRIVLSDAALGRLIGGIQHQLEGDSFADLLKLGEGDRFRGLLTRALYGQSDGYQEFVTQGSRLDGTSFEVSLTVIPAVLNGETAGAFVQVREITRLLRAERALALAELE